MYFIIVALRNLEKYSKTSEKVREKAAGALWKLDNRDQPQNRPKSAQRGSYILPLIIIYSNRHDNIYCAMIMTQPLREYT